MVLQGRSLIVAKGVAPVLLILTCVYSATPAAVILISTMFVIAVSAAHRASEHLLKREKITGVLICAFANLVSAWVGPAFVKWADILGIFLFVWDLIPAMVRSLSDLMYLILVILKLRQEEPRQREHDHDGLSNVCVRA